MERSELEEIMRLVDLFVCVSVCLSVCVHKYTSGRNGGTLFKNLHIGGDMHSNQRLLLFVLFPLFICLFVCYYCHYLLVNHYW